MDTLRAFQKTHIPKIEDSLQHFLDLKIAESKQQDATLEKMVRVLKEFVMRGGKRIRPLLTVLAHNYATQLRNSPSLGSGNIYQAASSVELHHLYILNLDDMADRDVLRHGGPTLEQYYKTKVFQTWKQSDHHGRTFSSIAGALLSSFVYESLMKSGFQAEALQKASLSIATTLTQDTVLGWQLHYFQNNESIVQSSKETFLKGLEYVTSRYTFVGPLRIGLQLAHDENVFAQIDPVFSSFGQNAGIAFQIHDDILGLFGDTQETGKAVGNDIREGKKTLLIQEAFAKATSAEKDFLQKVLGSQLSEKELDQVKEVVQKTGSLAYSEQLAREYVERAVSAIQQLPVHSKESAVLEELAEFLIQRKH